MSHAGDPFPRGRVDGMPVKATSPRPWAAMLETWNALLTTLAALMVPVGAVAPLVAVTSPKHPIEERRLWLQVWRWMWSLPPCSEARKAAFTLGAAALWIERWRLEWERFRPDAGDSSKNAALVDGSTGQRAEALLRIAAWHIDDARGEAHARTLGHEPTIPPHERVYHRTADGLVFVSMPGVAFSVPWTPAILAHAILEDHGGHTRFEQRRLWSAEHMFAELCIASLPDGPWVMTTRDVERFLELVQEDAAPGPWRRATHRTRGGDLEIRERVDGRYDVRAVGAEPIGWPMPDQMAERGVDAAYVRAEIQILDGGKC